MTGSIDNSKKYPGLGFGLGLRKEHYQDVLDSFSVLAEGSLPAEGSPPAEGSILAKGSSPAEGSPLAEGSPPAKGSHSTNSAPLPVDWFEILTENYLVSGGKPLYFLDKIAERYPMVMHGVSMNIGNSGALDWNYLEQVKTLKSRINAHWLSDHLCWTGTNGSNAHDLLPLPYTEESIKHVAAHISQVQDFLGCRMLIENVSSYVNYKQSEMTEWEFLTELAERADCLLLLDVNNIYVSSVNHEFDPLDYLLSIPEHRVQQFHLAGHSDYGDYVIDTHDMPVCDAVWNLYAKAVERFGEITFMIERDDNIPSLSELLQELNQAREISKNILQNGFDANFLQTLLSKEQAQIQSAMLKTQTLSI